MDRPDAHPSSELIYAGMAPFAKRDAEVEYHLLRWLDAILTGSGAAEIYDLVSDRDGLAGWESLLSPEDSPAEALAYLGQFVGETLEPALSELQARELIKNPRNFQRGSIPGMEAAAAVTLTGTKRVDFFERADGNVWKLAVRTYDKETPAEGVTRLALRSIKDVSLVLNYESIPGQTFQQLDDDWKTFKELDDHYTSFEEMLEDA